MFVDINNLCNGIRYNRTERVAFHVFGFERNVFQVIVPQTSRLFIKK